jgi:hypothetical protein
MPRTRLDRVRGMNTGLAPGCPEPCKIMRNLTSNRTLRVLREMRDCFR